MANACLIERYNTELSGYSVVCKDCGVLEENELGMTIVSLIHYDAISRILDNHASRCRKKTTVSINYRRLTKAEIRGKKQLSK